MDRRRFVPAPDNLEVRTMLSTAGVFGNSVSSTQPIPITFQQKVLRIQKIPLNLRALQPNRSLPVETIQQIQLGMYQVMSEMTQPPPQALSNYNQLLRGIVFNASLSSNNAQTLNHGFSAVLRAAKTPDPGYTALVSSVNQLVSQVDTASIQPVFLATNDSAYLLQLALVIGQQMPAPRAPTIAKSTGTQVNSQVAVSPMSQPVYTGSYEYGTTIQMVNTKTGEVIGQSIVTRNGQYSLRISTPLAVGKYYLAVRAVDEVGHIGHASRVFGLQVVPPKNAGSA